jgi:hypothetical protein
MDAADARPPVEVICTACGFGSAGEWTSRAADRQPINCPRGRGGCGAKVRVKRTQSVRAAPAGVGGQRRQAPTQQPYRTPATPQRPGRLGPAAQQLRRAPAPRSARPPAPYREPQARATTQRRAQLEPGQQLAQGTVPDSRQSCHNCRLEKRRNSSGRWPAAIWHIEVSGAQQFAADLCAKCFKSIRELPDNVILHVTEIATGRHYQLTA